MTTPTLADKTSAWGKDTRTYTIDGERYPSITTIIGLGIPKHLNAWYARTVAEIAVRERAHWIKQIREDVTLGDIEKHTESKRIHGLQSTKRLTKDEVRALKAAKVEAARIAWLKRAPDRDRDNAADAGTDAHAYLDARLSGTHITDMQRMVAGPYVDVIDGWADRWRPEPIRTEFTVVSEKHGYAGTGDFLAYFHGYGTVGGDAKTSRSGLWPEMALQLAALRYADYIAVVTYKPSGKRIVTKVDIPDWDVAAALWLRPPDEDHPDGIAEMYEVDAGSEMFDAFLAALDVAYWSKTRKPHAIRRQMTPPMLLPEHPVATLRDELHIRGAEIVAHSKKARKALRKMWPEDTPTFPEALDEKYHYTPADLRAIEFVLNFIEKDFGVPFSPPALNRRDAGAIQFSDDICDRWSDTELMGPAKKKETRKLFDRIRALPADLHGGVMSELNRQRIDVKNLTRGDLAPIEYVAEIGETLHARRLDSIIGLNDGLSGETVRMILDAIWGYDGEHNGKDLRSIVSATLNSASQEDADKWAALCSAFAAGWLKIADSDKQTRPANLHALTRLTSLVARYGSKSAVLDAASETADRYGLGRTPRSSIGVAESPLLSALMLWAGNAPGSDDRTAEEIHAALLAKFEKAEARKAKKQAQRAAEETPTEQE